MFRWFFEQVVEQCQQAGLVWGRELYIDATKVQANASKDSLKPRFFVEAHLSTLFSDHSEEATREGEQEASPEEEVSTSGSEFTGGAVLSKRAVYLALTRATVRTEPAERSTSRLD